MSSNKSARVGMVSLGCSKNQVDAERMLYTLKERGYTLVGDAALADVCIINTCGFIESAKQEAIDTILEFAELKKEGRIKAIIITGCLAQRYKDEIQTEIPEADAVVGLGSNSKIADIVEEVLSGKQVFLCGSKLELPLTGGRIQTTLPYYAYLKVAEGCSNCCAFCAIPAIRGKYRSVPMEELIAESRALAADGVKELVVIAQDTTMYGTDIYGHQALPELLKKLCAIEGLEWIRVLYLYPERITDEILDVIADEDKIVKYIEMPIQHCVGHILESMGRKGDEQSLRALISRIRERIPGVTLRTTLMTGFPGETEEDFERLAEFAADIRFDRLGCFSFSPEEGTRAAAMPDQVDDEVKEHRNDIIMEQQMLIMTEKNEQLVGTAIKCIVEGYDRYGECYFGRSAADAPDIDGKVFFTCPDRHLTMGDFVDVSVDEVVDYDLFGSVV